MIRRLRVIRRRLTDVPLATVIALLGINSAVTLFTQPARVPARQLLSPFDILYAVLYVAGGVGLLAGLASRRGNLEAAGCIAFAGGSLVSAVANAAVSGWAAWNTVAVLLVFAAGTLIRAWHIIHGCVLVLIQLDDGTGQLKVADDDPTG